MCGCSGLLAGRLPQSHTCGTRRPRGMRDRSLLNLCLSGPQIEGQGKLHVRRRNSQVTCNGEG